MLYTFESYERQAYGRAIWKCKNKTKITNNFVGTVDFLAPEVIEGLAESVDGSKVDVFAGGIMFGYMFSRVPPWQDLPKSKLKGVNPQSYMIMKAILEGKRPSMPSSLVCPELQEIVGQMVMHSPGERASFSHVHDFLKNYMKMKEIAKK